MRLFLLVPFILLLAPFSADALTTEQVLAFFNLVVGLMLTVSIVTFLGGFAVYLIRLGTWPTYRDEAVEIMRYGVETLFLLVVLLGAQQLLLRNMAVATALGGLLVIVLVIWIIVKAKGGKKEEEHH